MNIEEIKANVGIYTKLVGHWVDVSQYGASQALYDSVKDQLSIDVELPSFTIKQSKLNQDALANSLMDTSRKLSKVILMEGTRPLTNDILSELAILRHNIKSVGLVELKVTDLEKCPNVIKSINIIRSGMEPLIGAVNNSLVGKSEHININLGKVAIINNVLSTTVSDIDDDSTYLTSDMVTGDLLAIIGANIDSTMSVYLGVEILQGLTMDILVKTLTILQEYKDVVKLGLEEIKAL